MRGNGTDAPVRYDDTLLHRGPIPHCDWARMETLYIL